MSVLNVVKVTDNCDQFQCSMLLFMVLLGRSHSSNWFVPVSLGFEVDISVQQSRVQTVAVSLIMVIGYFWNGSRSGMSASNSRNIQAVVVSLIFGYLKSENATVVSLPRPSSSPNFD